MCDLTDKDRPSEAADNSSSALRRLSGCDEARRLGSLDALQILNTSPEDAYERIVRRVSEFFDTPICLIAFAGKHEQWFKAKKGVQAGAAPREASFCQAALESGDLFIVEDALKEPRFAHHPLVTGEPFARFYAGVPLFVEDRVPVGTLCVLDTKPRRLSEEECLAIKDFAAIVVDELHLRLRTFRLEAQLARQNQAEATALASQKARADFLAMVTHEVRAPLNAIAGMVTQLYEPDSRMDDPMLVESLRDSTAHLVRIVNEVLDLARLEATGFHFARAPFDLHRELRCALAIVRPQAAAKGIGLDLHISDVLPATLIGDRTRVAQIVLNLLSNAVKFTDRGKVTLSAEVSGKGTEHAELALRVTDTGVGMNADTLAKIFHGFADIAPGVREQYGGTGLGLAICAKLVQGMGGVIDVQSKPGVGTSIVCALPCEPAGPACVATPERNTQNEITREERLILVADDDAVSRRISAAQLMRLGYRVELAASGREALAALRTQPVDLALVDINMGDLDGYALSRELRAQSEFGAVAPLIALSGYSKPENGQWKLCFDDYLVKPASPSEIDEAILRVFAVRDGSPSARTEDVQ